jgi:hypothetical protein
MSYSGSPSWIKVVPRIRDKSLIAMCPWVRSTCLWCDYAPYESALLSRPRRSSELGMLVAGPYLGPVQNNNLNIYSMASVITFFILFVCLISLICICIIYNFFGRIILFFVCPSPFTSKKKTNS